MPGIGLMLKERVRLPLLKRMAKLGVERFELCCVRYFNCRRLIGIVNWSSRRIQGRSGRFLSPLRVFEELLIPASVSGDGIFVPEL